MTLKKDERRKSWMQLRVDAKQYARWKRAAAVDGRTLSAWVRRALDAREAAERKQVKP